MFPPAAINGLFDLPLPQGQALQELQHGPTENTKELLTGVSSEWANFTICKNDILT